MKINPLTIRHTVLKAALACAVIGCLAAADLAPAQTAPAPANPPALSPDLQEIMTLSQQHMGDEVITNFIHSSGKAYTLSANDIIYLNSQGVSSAVINALLQTSANASAPLTPAAPATPAVPATPAPAAPAPAAPATPAAATAAPQPPPIDGSDTAAPAAMPAPSAPAPATPAVMPVAPMLPAPFVDNFASDYSVNPSLWETQSGLLSALAAGDGLFVPPVLAFGPSGMQMSGVSGMGEFMGIKSRVSFSAPFAFRATVAARVQDGVPFAIYLVSADLQQWVSVSGHLGGRGGGHERIGVGLGFAHFIVSDRDRRSPDYGVWINHTGNGLPISALGNLLYAEPIAGVPYTIQITSSIDGTASVSLLDPSGFVLGAQTVPVGTGPFYIVLAGRQGRTFADWQSVQLTPAAPAVMPMAAPVVATDVPATPDMAYFQSQLAPYGNWITVPGYGLCWQPAVNPGWRPYYDGGYWQYTDAGWYWQSDYPWGDIAFHYGRWAYTAYGWVWVPGYDYAPAWVVWRHADSDGYVGWAPLPPGAVFVNGGWMYNGVSVGADFDFGLGVNFFAFVSYDHFWEHDFRHWVVPHDRVVYLYHRSAVINHYQFDHGRFVNVGIGRDRMAGFTHRDVNVIAVHDLRAQEEHHNFVARQDDIHHFTPGGHPDAFHSYNNHPGGGGGQGGDNNHSGGGGQNKNWNH